MGQFGKIREVLDAEVFLARVSSRLVMDGFSVET